MRRRRPPDRKPHTGARNAHEAKMLQLRNGCRGNTKQRPLGALRTVLWLASTTFVPSGPRPLGHFALAQRTGSLSGTTSPSLSVAAPSISSLRWSSEPARYQICAYSNATRNNIAVKLGLIEV